MQGWRLVWQGLQYPNGLVILKKQKMKLTTKVLVIAVLVLASALSVFVFLWDKESKERKRQDHNVEQLTSSLDQANINLKLTHKEFEDAKTEWKFELDSVMNAHKIALKSVKSATIIHTEYKDTGSVKIVYKEPVFMPNSKDYTIPVSYQDLCWGMKGTIISKDPDSKLNIQERTQSNSSQLFVVRKRLLGFLWYQNRKTEYRAFTDCGEIEFVQIYFVKK